MQLLDIHRCGSVRYKILVCAFLYWSARYKIWYMFLYCLCFYIVFILFNIVYVFI
jgi:hypothetical protein